jgi:tyrosinase
MFVKVMKKFILALILALFATVGILPPTNAYAQSTQVPELTQSTQLIKSPRTKYVRKDVYSRSGQKDLQSLKIALKKIRESGCTDPVSWYYQGAIHGVPSPVDFTEQNSLCPIYTNASSLDPKTQAQIKKLLDYWQKCPHEAGTGVHFLPWHRLYLYHFEQVVRNLSDNPNFAIPYWDYTSSKSAKYKLMPEAFRLPTDQTTNGLYEELRLASLNAGQPIEPSTQQGLIDGKRTAYQNILYSVFNSQIEQSPHNVIHGYIGGSFPKNKFNPIWQGPSPYDEGVGLMGDVPTAGFDPIFWLHHASIDRYWQSWTLAKGSSSQVTPQELAAVKFPYAFFDGKGELVEYKTPEEVVKAVYNLNYTYDKYDQLLVRPRSLTNIQQPRARLQEILVTKEVKAQLTDEPTTVVIPLSTTRGGDRSLLANQENGYVLEVEVSFQGKPRGTYDVYVNLPNTEAAADKDVYYAGTISFFELPSKERVTKTLLFDITDQLADQVDIREQQPQQDLKVTFLPKNGEQREEVFIEKISLRKL